MRQGILRTRAVLTVLLTGTALLLWSGTSFAAPALGADCGAGASIVGSDSAGKVELGTGARTCTLTHDARPGAAVGSKRWRAGAGIAPRYDALERKGVSLPGRARRVAD